MSSINGLGQDPSLYLQVAYTSPQPFSTPAPKRSATIANDGGIDAGSSSLPTSDGGGRGGLLTKVVDAVSNALQSALSESTTAPADPNTVIQNAIAKLMAGNSSPPPTNSGSATSITNDQDRDGDSDAAGQAGNDSSSTSAAFLQTLQNFGVNPAQFRQDFLAATQSANPSAYGSSPLSQAFPPGTFINQLA